jgi:hypothetical protein
VADRARPALGDFLLPLVQRVVVEESQVVVNHRVPGLDVGRSQHLNRAATRIRVHGVLTGDQAGTDLERLRDLFHTAEPVAFVADAVTGTRLRQVVLVDLRVTELAGRPMTYRYDVELTEYVEPPEATLSADVDAEARTEAGAANAAQVEGLADGLGGLEVRVELAEGDDWSRVAVAIEGADDEGNPFSLLIEEQTEGLYTALGLRASTYTARAVPR